MSFTRILDQFSKSIVRKLKASLTLSAAVLSLSAGTAYAQQAAPTTVFEEDFQGATDPSAVTSYNGFSADPYWASTANCNGILLSNNTATSSGNVLSCGSGQINNLGLIAAELGGGDNTNIAASSYTQGGAGGASIIQLESPQFTVGNNRFYQASVDVGAQNCGRPGPSHQFAITDVGGNDLLLGAPQDVCNLDSAGAIRIATVTSPIPIRWDSGTTASLKLFNLNGSRIGNDSAVDNLRLIDVTPRLSKSFPVSPIFVGESTPLEFTITNRTDNQVKTDMSFTDTLQAGMSVDPAVTPTTTCGNGVVTASGSVITVTGADLADGEVSCIITLNVIGDSTGSFTNGAPEISDLLFLDPPLAPTPLVVLERPPAPSLAMTKVADNPGPHNVGDVVTYTYTVENDGDEIIRDIAITDTHNGSDPAPVPGNETLLTDAAPTGDSTDAAIDGSWDVLAPGDVVTFTGTYTVTQPYRQSLVGPNFYKFSNVRFCWQSRH